MLDDASFIWRERSDEDLIGPTVGLLEDDHTTALAIECVFSINGFCVNVNIICSLLDKVGLTIGLNDYMRKIWPLFDLFNFMISNACKSVLPRGKMHTTHDCARSQSDFYNHKCGEPVMRAPNGKK